jgi:hypothetical protein
MPRKEKSSYYEELFKSVEKNGRWLCLRYTNADIVYFSIELLPVGFCILFFVKNGSASVVKLLKN